MTDEEFQNVEDRIDYISAELERYQSLHMKETGKRRVPLFRRLDEEKEVEDGDKKSNPD